MFKIAIFYESYVASFHFVCFCCKSVNKKTLIQDSVFDRCCQSYVMHFPGNTNGIFMMRYIQKQSVKVTVIMIIFRTERCNIITSYNHLTTNQ